MAHNLFGDRFFSNRGPAWHKLGIVNEEAELTAREVGEKIGVFYVDIQPLQTPSGLVVPQRAVVRYPTPDDPNYQVLGLVGLDYELLDPSGFLSMWDEYVERPVGTLGFLGKGHAAFISTPLPSVDIRGDEVQNHLMAANFMDGSRALEGRVTNIRPVCQNTVNAGLLNFTYALSVVHTAGAREKMGAWLGEMYQEAVDKIDVVKDAYTVLADHVVTMPEVKFVLDATYIDPPMPRNNAPVDVMEERLKNWEGWRDAVRRRKLAVKELFDGRGMGMNTRAARGTAWGLFQACVENENYRRTTSETAAAMSVMYGERRQNMLRAYDACVKVVRGDAEL